MRCSRRQFFGRAATAAVVAPVLPKLAWQGSAPGDRDATRWLQRKINALRPGDTLRVPPRWYRVDGTLVVGTPGVAIADINLYRDPPSPAAGMSIEAKDVSVHDVLVRWIRRHGGLGRDRGSILGGVRRSEVEAA